ncbi:unnamed protein product [Blepharisma stoltei]|uniref:Uncharacterized protein n=1 Tax=Blepharisma stoltei TaxID=1481888 RepID=A0AAU9IJZ5_9CILI|nr:unnamed protein product [Blepharisma stoltei]
MNSEELKNFLHSFKDDLSKMIRFEMNKALGKYVETAQDFAWDETPIQNLHDFFHTPRIRHIYDSSLVVNFSDYIKRLKLSKELVYKKLNESNYYLPELSFFTSNFLDDLIAGSKNLLQKSEVKLINCSGTEKSTFSCLAKSYVRKDKNLQSYMPNTPNMDPGYVINVVNTFYPLEEGKKIIDFSNQIKENLKKIQTNIPAVPDILFDWKPAEFNMDGVKNSVNEAMNQILVLKDKIKKQKEEQIMEEKANQMVVNLLEVDYNEAQFAQLMN